MKIGDRVKVDGVVVAGITDTTSDSFGTVWHVRIFLDRCSGGSLPPIKVGDFVKIGNKPNRECSPSDVHKVLAVYNDGIAWLLQQGPRENFTTADIKDLTRV